MDEPNRMSINDFRKLGYLQEVNRQFFHPLGLALEIAIDEDGNETLSGIWDCREDPEGILYARLDDVESRSKALYVTMEQEAAREAREEAFGFYIQPSETLHREPEAFYENEESA